MCLRLEPATHPPLLAVVHANPPEEAFHHFKSVRDTGAAGDVGVTCVHDPRSCQKWHIDAKRIVERLSG